MRETATGRDAGPVPAFVPGAITWGAGQWREEAYSLVPARPRSKAERDAGEPLDWYAAIRTWAADTATWQSWEYAVCGTKGFTFVEASREIASGMWTGSCLVAPGAPESIHELTRSGLPPALPPTASRGSCSSPGSSPFDEALSNEVGHLPQEAQSFLLRDHVSAPAAPQRWRTWRIRGERGGHLRDERWYWIVGRRKVSFAGATRQLADYFAPGREWRGSHEGDLLDLAPWKSTVRVIEASGVPVIRTFTMTDQQLR